MAPERLDRQDAKSARWSRKKRQTANSVFKQMSGDEAEWNASRARPGILRVLAAQNSCAVRLRGEVLVSPSTWNRLEGRRCLFTTRLPKNIRLATVVREASKCEQQIGEAVEIDRDLRIERLHVGEA